VIPLQVFKSREDFGRERIKPVRFFTLVKSVNLKAKK
jgi:hypothetical protein